MTLDSNWVLAVIAVATVISPVIVTWLNNRHAERLKEIELGYNRQLKQFDIVASQESSAVELLATFVSEVNNYFFDTDDDRLVAINNVSPKLMLYFEGENQTLIALTRDRITQYGSGQLAQPEMSDQIETLNAKVPELLDCIEQRSMRPLPEVPNLRISRTLFRRKGSEPRKHR